MVTTKLMGGLGNQLFMIAATIAYAAKHNMDYVIPLKVENPHYPDQKPYIFPFVKYSDEKHEIPLYNEPFFAYQEIPKMESVCLNGYWQSEKYFAEYRDLILKSFGFEYKRCENVIAIHVRRGDYLRLPDYHPAVTMDYISKAVQLFKNAAYSKFKVFSDDMAWCKENINSTTFPNLSFEYSDGKSEIEDMVYASHCDHLIGSNSTFSWWVHYLCQYPQKIATFPATWFGRFLMQHDTKDLYPKNCIKI